MWEILAVAIVFLLLIHAQNSLENLKGLKIILSVLLVGFLLRIWVGDGFFERYTSQQWW